MFHSKLSEQGQNIWDWFKRSLRALDASIKKHGFSKSHTFQTEVFQISQVCTNNNLI